MQGSPHPKAGLIVHSRHPFNAEPELDRLRSSFTTSISDFYVRSHGDTPRIEESQHRLRVDGKVSTPLHLSVADLRAGFAPRAVMAIMQCAGNRRADMQPVRPTSGDPWAPGAIGNAEWTGVALSDLLRAAGAANDPGLHVAFTSADMVDMPEEGCFSFGVSIPMSKAVCPEVLIAYAMNGEPLAPEHGFPLRALVPGYAGVRSAKWLTVVTVQELSSDNPMQSRDYRLLPFDVTAETVDWERGIVINEMPLNSAICEPKPHARLAAGRVIVRGYATATARQVARVDVSPDGGRSWRQAKLERSTVSPWSWTFWDATFDLAAGEHELAVRAWDASGQTQPSDPRDVWNFKGYLSAAWHRVPVSVA